MWGQVAALLIEALRYKAEVRVRFPMVSLEFFTYIILPGLGSAQPVTDEYQEYFLGGGGKGGRCVGLTTIPSSYADYLEIWEPQPPGTLKTCTGIALPCTISHGIRYGKIIIFVFGAP